MTGVAVLAGCVLAAVLAGLAIVVGQRLARRSTHYPQFHGTQVERDGDRWRWWCTCASYGWRDTEQHAWLAAAVHVERRLEAAR